MSNIGDILTVLVKNSDDVEELVRRFGGVANLVKAGPAIYRIMNTIADRHPDNTEQAAEQIEKVLYYSDATRERVRAFQKAHGLTADGLIGNRTWSKVEELLKEKAK